MYMNMYVHGGILNFSNIKNADAPYEIFVRIPGVGKTISLDVQPSDTIKTIKAKIYEK